jgi:hypothetical protein
MASTTETGHAKNVANFGLLIAEVTQMGADYNPTNPSIALTALTTKKAACDHVMERVITSTVPYKNAVNARDMAYAGMSKLSSRILSALEGSGASKDIIKDAKGLVNKIKGRRTGKIKDGDPANPGGGSISVSQLSYDNMKANFDMLVALVKGQTLYNPNETALKIAALEAYALSLVPLNETVNTTIVDLQDKRTERNEELYAPETGLFEIAKKVRVYVKSIYGANSPVYKRMVRIIIKKMVR